MKSGKFQAIKQYLLDKSPEEVLECLAFDSYLPLEVLPRVVDEDVVIKGVTYRFEVFDIESEMRIHILSSNNELKALGVSALDESDYFTSVPLDNNSLASIASDSIWTLLKGLNMLCTMQSNVKLQEVTV